MDLSAYDLLDTFTLHDASYLLCGYAPLSPGPAPRDDPHEIIRHKAGTIASQLVGDAQAGKLVAIKQDIGESWYLAGAPEWIATRQALKNWATAKERKPAFLFPEVRAKNTIMEKKESTVLTENLYRALICLAMDGYKYDSNDSKSKVPKQLSDMLLDKYSVQISQKTIKRWLNKGATLVEQQPLK